MLTTMESLSTAFPHGFSAAPQVGGCDPWYVPAEIINAFAGSIPPRASRGQQGPPALSYGDRTLLPMRDAYLRLAPSLSWRRAPCACPSLGVECAAPPHGSRLEPVRPERGVARSDARHARRAKGKDASSAIRQAMKREYDSGEFTKSRPNLPF